MTILPFPPQSPPVINSNAEVKPNNRDEQATPLEPKTNKEQEAPMFDSNNNGKKIREEIVNLRERIMERVEKNLEEKGIELDLP
jgi:hypothetical protein